MGLEMNINDFKEEDIRKEAHAIYIRRKENGISGSPFSDWLAAINQLKHLRDFRENWTKGCCGQ